MSVELFLQRVIDGISDGMIYGAVALALVLIYRATGLINFAQGEMAMFVTFIVWTIARPDTFGIPMPLAVVIGAAAGFVLGAVLQRLVMRPFESRDHLSQAMVTMGLFLGINSLAAYLFSVQPVKMSSVFGSGTIVVGGVSISWGVVGLVIVFLCLSLALQLLITRTSFGLAMRAATNNPISAQLHGVNVSRTLMIGWGLAGALGAVAGALVAPKLFVSPTMMQAVLLYAFAAAVVGGLDSALGAIVGGVLVGVTQHLAGGYLFGSELQLASALIMILIVLLVRPQGLFGQLKVARV